MQSHRVCLEKGSDQKAAATCGLAGASCEQWGCFQSCWCRHERWLCSPAMQHQLQRLAQQGVRRAQSCRRGKGGQGC